MRLRNSSQSWGLIARLLHWVVAAMIVGQVITGWMAENAGSEDASLVLIRNHYQFGIVLTGLILMRILWRLADHAPSADGLQPQWQKLAALGAHSMIYILLIILPVSGYIVWIHMREAMDVFGLFAIPRLFTPSADDESLWSGAWYVHYFAGWALIGLVLIHISAALWHQFVLRDGLIRRMIG